MALILRNGGSQSPDRWLKEPRNNQTFRAEFNDEITVDEIFELVGIPFEKTWNLLFNNTLQEFSHPL